MIKPDEVKTLANLARVSLTPQEEMDLAQDLEKILAYFEELKRVPTETAGSVTAGESKNVWREDLAPHSSQETGEHYKVKKILG